MPGMTPEDVYQLTGAADPRISPDGRLVAYTVSTVDKEENEYRRSIWVAAIDGSEAPRRYTTGPKADGAPRWSPDGKRLAFTSNRERETPQLYVMPVEGGGEPTRLTDATEGVGPPTWSPDGQRIAYGARVRDPAYEEEDERKRAPRRFKRLQYKLDNEGWTGDRRTHLFVVPADGSAEPTQLTDGDYEDEQPSWSPDGSRIAFVSGREDDWDIRTNSDIYLVSAEGGEPERLTHQDGYHAAPTWSPDGTRIASKWIPGGKWDFPHHGQIAVVDASTGERRLLTESLDRTCAPYPDLREPIWDGDEIVFALEDRGNIHIYRVPADGSREPELMLGGEQMLNGYDAAAGHVVHTASTPTTLTELYRDEQRLTEIGKEFTSSRELSEPERFTATSEDGAEVDAWIMRPAGFEEGRRYPVLLNIHGGPFTQYGNTFFDEFQVYAGAGYVVVYCNPRGSSGYDEEWGRAIRGPVEGGPGWGTRDYEDVMAVLDEALERFDFCDPERLGVMGGSYGGYLTSWIVSHTDRFHAACSERAVNNLLSEFGSSDFGWVFKGYTGAWPFEDADAHLRHSPWTYAENITTPLLIVHSENDLRCAIEQAEQLFTTLRLFQRDVEFVRFPAESHELTRSGSPIHRVMRFEILLEWFDRYLRPGERVEANVAAGAAAVARKAR